MSEQINTPLAAKASSPLKSFFTDKDYKLLIAHMGGDEEAVISKISQIEKTLKNPLRAFFDSLILGILAVDRFYIGDKRLAWIKLLTAGGLLLWGVLDIFMIWGVAKRKNMQLACAALGCDPGRLQSLRQEQGIRIAKEERDWQVLLAILQLLIAAFLFSGVVGFTKGANDTISDLNRIAEQATTEVVTVDANTAPLPSNEKKFIQLTGMAQLTSPIVDPDFGVSDSRVLFLKRVVEILAEKRESTRTGNVLPSYAWLEHAPITITIDGHVLPRSVLHKPEVLKIGEYPLSSRAIAQVPDTVSWELYPLTERNLYQARPEYQDFFKVFEGRYYSGDPSSPKPNDVRVSFFAAPLGGYTLIGKQRDGKIDLHLDLERGERFLVMVPGAASGVAGSQDWMNKHPRGDRLTTFLILYIFMNVFLFLAIINGRSAYDRIRLLRSQGKDVAEETGPHRLAIKGCIFYTVSLFIWLFLMM